MPDIIGWVATLIFVWASIDVAHKNIRGLYLMLLGNSLFAYVGIMTGVSSLVGVSVIMSILDIYGIRKWRQEDIRAVFNNAVFTLGDGNEDH